MFFRSDNYKIKLWIILGLTACFALTSCSAPQVDRQQIVVSDFYDYSAEDLFFCVDGYDLGIRDIAWGDTCFAVLGIGYNEEILSAENAWFDNMGMPDFKVLPTDSDGNICVRLKELFFYDYSGKLIKEVNLDDVQGYSYELPLLGVDSSGNIHAIVCNGDITTSELHYHDLTFDSQGELVSNTELLFDQHIDVYAVYYDPDGSILLFGTDNTNYESWIYSFDDSGMIKTETMFSGYVKQFVEIDGELYALGYSYNEDDHSDRMSFIPVNNIIKGSNDQIVLPPESCFEPESAISIDGGSSVFIYEYPFVYYCNYDTGDERIISDFTSCPCPYSPYRSVNVNEVGDILYVGLDSILNQPAFCTATHSDTDPNEGKTRLTIAGVGIKNDAVIANMVKMFNMNSDEYLIDIIDYSGSVSSDSDEYYENLEYYYSTFIDDIRYSHLSEGAPDIIVDVWDAFPFDEISGDEFLVELSEYVNSETTLSPIPWYEDLCSDSVYEVFPAYHISLLAVDNTLRKIDDCDTVNYSEYDHLSQDYGFNGLSLIGMTKTDYLAYIVQLRSEFFFDTDTNKVRFDSSEFVDLLEWVNHTIYDDDSHYSSVGNGAFGTTETVVHQEVLIYDIGTLSGRDYSLIGFPTEESNLVAAIPQYIFAITSDCECPDIAWDFISSAFSPRYQEIYSRINFVVAGDVSDSMCEQSFADIEDESYREQLLARTDTLLNSVNCIYYPNNDLRDIIIEEAGSYFYGNISAEVVADRIQNRASLIMAEYYS